MICQINYDDIAELYDLYASTGYDFNFFTSQINLKGKKVIELTSGTGRLSIPLIAAGANLTCVDISQGMLDVLNKKLKSKQLSANVLCSDICDLSFEAEFDLAIFPFQSIMELVGKDKQIAALTAIHRALKDGGKFFCTIHNPAIRKKVVDGTLRIVGSFPTENGTLVVSGFEQGGHPIVKRTQIFEFYDEKNVLERKQILPMEFELIEKQDFEKMAVRTGFKIINFYGDYDMNKFDSMVSPVMIWELEKASF